MKLFLCSSYRTNIDAFKDLLAEDPSHIVLGVIKNPLDPYETAKREQRELIENARFDSLGVIRKDIDLRDYLANPQDFKQILDGLDALWITGGYLFYTRYLIEQLGIGGLLVEAIADGLIYGGESTGTLLMAPTLMYLDLPEDTSMVPEIIYEGLGVLDFVLLPHWDNEQYYDVVRTIKELMEEDGHRVVTINDNQAMVINGNSVTIIDT